MKNREDKNNMGKEIKKGSAFLYADKEQQLIRANRFLAIGYSVYYGYVMLMLLTSLSRNERSLGFCSVIGLLVVISLGAIWTMVKTKPASPRLRYIALIGLCFISWVISYAYTQDFARLIGCFPLIGCILFFDMKFALRASGAYAVTIILVNVVQMGIEKSIGGTAFIDEIFVTSAVILLLALTCFVTRIAALFNEHSVGAAKAEQERQKEIMDDVISVAEEVRKGTENAMDIINKLNTSSEVVNGAMGDISSSTQTTAESIQTQTEMTQNIQDSINVTIQSSENMVRVAQQSDELNQQNLQLMGALKQQSEVIAQTNGDVADSMRALQERTNAVKGIADTIFSISNQTNLLALNASIESARAGEAGRGFAVVADEIRQLAAKTRQETENIARILDELSANAEEAANAVGRSMEAAGVQEHMIEQVSMSFEEMSNNVNGLISEIENIDSMLASLSEANNQIVDNITYLSATTEEVTASSAQASDMTIENLDNAETAKSELSNILRVSHQLDKYIQ